MMSRTHIAIAIFAMLLFIKHVDYKVTFIFVTLIATLLPDVDCYFSKLGKKKIARPIQFITRHRGVFHSFTFAILISLILSLFPLTSIFALPFFLGYGLHVLVDSFTVEGVHPFWPYKKISSGKLKTGKVSELSLFIFFIVVDALLAIFLLN